jgi:hypothetical protein
MDRARRRRNTWGLHMVSEWNRRELRIIQNVLEWPYKSDILPEGLNPARRT